jgi:hypothetical protein
VRLGVLLLLLLLQGGCQQRCGAVDGMARNGLQKLQHKQLRQQPLQAAQRLAQQPRPLLQLLLPLALLLLLQRSRRPVQVAVLVLLLQACACHGSTGTWRGGGGGGSGGSRCGWRCSRSSLVG